MKVIVVAATKGGAGKTTLAFNLAGEAAQNDTVYLADLDPQHSLRNTCQRRADRLSKEPPRKRKNGSAGADENMELLDLPLTASIPKVIESLRRTGHEKDWMVVDTPGALISAVLRDALTAADVIVIPLQPSILDLEAQLAIVGLIRQLGRGDRVVFVVNRMKDTKASAQEMEEANALFAHMRAALPVPTLQVADRDQYKAGMRSGKTGREERSTGAGTEMAALWAEVRKLARTANEDQAVATRRGRQSAR